MDLFAYYQSYVPAVVRRRLHLVVDSPATLRLFLTYLLIGAFAVGIDFVILALLLRNGVIVPLAVSIAFFCSVLVHFILNKYYNFRNFDRTLWEQAKTYIVLSVTVWLLTVGWVEFFTREFGIPVLIAKALSTPLTVVIGYLSTRYLAFGPGIVRFAQLQWASRRGNRSKFGER